MTKSATVTSGPDVWIGKSGAVLSMDLEWCIVELVSKDDCGLSVYNVRFPISCVKVVQELAVA
jgi:hypothetical protein